MKSGTTYDQLDWWQRQWRGSFDLGLYLEICRIKKNEQIKFNIKDENNNDVADIFEKPKSNG